MPSRTIGFGFSYAGIYATVLARDLVWIEEIDSCPSEHLPADAAFTRAVGPRQNVNAGARIHVAGVCARLRRLLFPVPLAWRQTQPAFALAHQAFAYRPASDPILRSSC